MAIPPEFRPLIRRRIDRASTEASIAFLEQLWDYPVQEYTVMGVKSGDWWKDPYIKGDRARGIAEILTDYPPSRYDIYFCPNAFDRPSRKTPYALSTNYGWCDIDDNDIGRYNPQPNILWETSPGRFQGIWIWREPAEGKIAEQYSRNIVYKQGGDQGGWSITKMLRLPGTINHKSDYNRPIVMLRAYDKRPQKVPPSISTIEKRKAARTPASAIASGDDRGAIMRRYRRKMGLPAGALMTARRVLREDRSGAVFLIVSGLIDAGAPDADIVTVLVGNPYFVAKWGTDRARAEQEVATIRARLEGKP